VTVATVRLKNVATVRVSNVDKKSVAGEPAVRLCNYTDVYYADRITGDRDFMVATATPDQISTFALRRGQTIITKDSEAADDIGVPAFVDIEAPDLICGYHLAQITPDPSLVDSRFLFWSVASDRSREQFAVGASGVTRFGLRTDLITSVSISLPALERQRRIAAFLDGETARLDALITAKTRMAFLAEDRAHLAISEDLAGFSSAPLKRFAAVIDCVHRTPTYVPNGYPVVSPGDVTAGPLDLSRCKRFVGHDDWLSLASGPRRPRLGDIVYSRNASVGLAALVVEVADFCMGQDVCLVRPVRSDGDGRFLTYVLNTVGLRQIEEQKIGSTFSRINVPTIAQLGIPALSESEQDRFVRRWDVLEMHRASLTSALNRQIALLKERRQALITAAVTGEIEV